MSAALNILLYYDAAVSEHGAGHVGEEGPRVAGGLVGFHVAQRRPLTADNASGCINLAIKHHGTVGGRAGIISRGTAPSDPERDSPHPVLLQAASPLLQSCGISLLFFAL